MPELARIVLAVAIHKRQNLTGCGTSAALYRGTVSQTLRVPYDGRTGIFSNLCRTIRLTIVYNYDFGAGVLSTC